MSKRRTPYSQADRVENPAGLVKQPDPAARPSEAPPSDDFAEDGPGADGIEYPPHTLRGKKGE